MTRLARIFAALAAPMLLLTPLFAGTASAGPPGNSHFNRTWQRTDLPVADLIVDRTWIWGPDGRTDLMVEPYAESPGGERTVQYFDKSRMEVTHPDGDPNSVWYVTNGLLVVELITGRMQIGDNLFEEREPAAVPVAGDGNDPNGPTYETMASVLDAPAKPVGEVYLERLSRSGQVTVDQSLAAEDVRAAHIDEVTGHAIAGPFWDFMNSSGLVYENGQYIEALMFQHPLFGTGRPVAEAYWAEVLIAGTPTDVLMQCFERRCLTYNPSNSEGWQVEAGNVGIHYYEWRYGADEDPGQGDPPPADPGVDDPPPADPPPGNPPGDVPGSPINVAVNGHVGSVDGPYVSIRFQFGDSTQGPAPAVAPASQFEPAGVDVSSVQADSFNIYRQSAGDSFGILADVDANDLLFQEHVYLDETVSYGAEYCYYVTAVNRHGESAPSETVCVHVPYPPNDPRMLNPPAGYTSYDREIDFEWETVAGATGYVLCILRPQYVGVHCDFELDPSYGYLVWVSPADGQYTADVPPSLTPDGALTELYWTVTACAGSAYDCGSFDEYRQLHVDLRDDLAAPILIGEEVDQNDPRRFVFTWELAPGAERYVICAAEPGANCEFETGNFYKSSILGAGVNTYPLDIPVWLAPDGQDTNLNWTVAACDADLNCVWQYNFRSFVVQLDPGQELEPPELLSPPDGYTTDGNYAELTWAPVDGAASYRVCIAYEVGARCPGNNVNMSAYFDPSVTSYPFWFHDHVLKEFEWSVATCDENGDCVWQEQYRSLIFDRQLDPPELIGVAVDPNDPGRFTFSWNVVQGAERYIVCVAEPGANCEHEVGAWYKSSVLGPSVDSHPMDIPLWLAPDGQVTNLNWTVAACDADLNCVWQYSFQSIVVDRS